MKDTLLTEDQIKLIIKLIKMEDIQGEENDKLDEIAEILLEHISQDKKG